MASDKGSKGGSCPIKSGWGPIIAFLPIGWSKGHPELGLEVLILASGARSNQSDNQYILQWSTNCGFSHVTPMVVKHIGLM